MEQLLTRSKYTWVHSNHYRINCGTKLHHCVTYLWPLKELYGYHWRVIISQSILRPLVRTDAYVGTFYWLAHCTNVISLRVPYLATTQRRQYLTWWTKLRVNESTALPCGTLITILIKIYINNNNGCQIIKTQNSKFYAACNLQLRMTVTKKLQCNGFIRWLTTSNLIDKHFPIHHKFHKLFNRNSVKI